MKVVLKLIVPVVLAWACAALAQTMPQSQEPKPAERRGQSAYLDTSGSVPVYKVTVVGRTTKAINLEFPF